MWQQVMCWHFGLDTEHISTAECIRSIAGYSVYNPQVQTSPDFFPKTYMIPSAKAE